MSVRRWSVVAAVALVVVTVTATALRLDRAETAADTPRVQDPLDETDAAELLEPWALDPPAGDSAVSGADASGDDGPSTLRVWALPDLPTGFEDDVAALEGVTDVITTRRGLVHLAASWDGDGQPVDEPGSGQVVPMQAVALDGDGADLDRELAALGADEVALSAAAARLRDAEPGSVLDLDGHRLTVAAVLADEVAGSSEVLLSPESGERFDFGRRAVTVRHVGDSDELREAIAALLPSDVTARIRTPTDDASGPLVRGVVAMKQRFGEFAHGPLRADGGFSQDPAWVDANITTARVPILGAITCHRDFIPIVAGALTELEEAGLAHLIDPADYEGCWAPRQVSSGRTISKHAWGAAIDINASTNAYGQTPTLDQRVVETFRRWGMRWGGDFIVPDGMHFEWYEDPPSPADDGP